MDAAVTRNIGYVDNVRDLLGMRSGAAWVILALYSVSNIAMAIVNYQGVRHTWVVTAAAVVMSVAAVSLCLCPGDPLPVRFAIPIAATGPLCIAVVLSQLPVPVYNAEQLWPVAATVAILTFLCVRGATMWAWLGTSALLGVIVYWAVATGQGVAFGLGCALINLAPMLMATFFAYTVRPTAQSILRLREKSNLRAGEEAATAAVLDERDAQLDRLDALARPLLELIASGERLTPVEQEQCALLEAQLRDRLRAGLIVDDSVAAAARGARGRGVSVALLDDGGLDACSPEIRQAVRTAVGSALEFARSGSVAARVLPPGRENLATVLVSEGDTDYRLEVALTGEVRSDLVGLIRS